MNGELQHMAELVMMVKAAMMAGVLPDIITMRPHIKEETFVFAPVKKLFFGHVSATAKGAVSWFGRLKAKGLRSIRLLGEPQKDINRMGFANGLSSCMIGTGYAKDSAAWAKQWEFDQMEKKWVVTYREIRRIGGIPTPDIEDPALELHNTLVAIAGLADMLDCSYFADVFRKADGILMADAGYHRIDISMPDMNQRLYDAAINAWVFGAMGSWNDSPPYMAQVKGLSKEYDELTAALYRGILNAILYAVNMW